MKVDLIGTAQLAKAGRACISAEEAGYDGYWTAETQHDPFLGLAVAADVTSNIQLGTSIAVAFARNPMNLAHIARDLQDGSEGRFILGLGSQIKPHITKRFSMPWGHPAKRMREQIMAMRAIWACWNSGEKLRFKGEFYTHILMTPFFDPGPSEYEDPKVYLAGVGPLMTEVAGEVCDGFLVHPFTTADYMRDVTIPALQRGMARSGRRTDSFEICLPPLIATGSDKSSFEKAIVSTRERIAFYGSTPAYAAVLEHHDRGSLHAELNAMSKNGEWKAMGKLIDDDFLHEVAIVAEPGDLGAAIVDRFGSLVDRITYADDQALGPAATSAVLTELKASS